jgi:hypothetical protein
MSLNWSKDIDQTPTAAVYQGLISPFYPATAALKLTGESNES